MTTLARPMRVTTDQAGAETGAQCRGRRPAEKTGLRPSRWPAIQRCGNDSACGCAPHQQLEGAERDLQRATATGGAPLPSGTKQRMQQAFSFDFDAVRVHTDTAASDTAAAFEARAMTAGTDIVFGAGEYAPGTANGDRLLAHELAHVVQQSQGLPRQRIDSGPHDGLERAARLAADRATPVAEHEADGAARIAATGGSVPTLSRQPRTIARQDKDAGAPPGPLTVPVSAKADPIAVRTNALDFVNNVSVKYGDEGGHTQLTGELTWTTDGGKVSTITSTWAITENYPSVVAPPPSASIADTELAACRSLADRIKQHEDKHAEKEKTRREKFLSTLKGSAEADASTKLDTMECELGAAQRVLDCAEGKITLDSANRVVVSGVDHPEYIPANCAAKFKSGGCGAAPAKKP